MTERPRSLTVRELSKRKEGGDVIDFYPRPSTREECLLGPRPCPYVGCKFNLYLDVLRTGSIKLNFPDLEPDEMGVSCVLDVADEGGATLEVVGSCFNLTRERIRQIEARALMKLEQSDGSLSEYLRGEDKVRHILDEMSDDAPF